MKLTVQKLWSPDLDPPSEGFPDDIENFDVLMQVSLGEKEKLGSEVFSFSVTSASALSRVEANRFVSHVLVMDYFDWTQIHKCINKLLLHTESCKNWHDVIKKLSGCLKYSDKW